MKATKRTVPKVIRMVVAAAMLLSVTALLLDNSGTMLHGAAWIPKVQLLPALLAGNFVMAGAVILMCLLVGRIYCSVICTLGIAQDVFTWIGTTAKKMFHIGSRHRFSYHKELRWLRYVVLLAFVVLMLTGMNGLALLIAPYSTYGRIIRGIVSGGTIMWVAVVSATVIFVSALLGGRLWCNTICPVGTLLGTLSRHSVTGIGIDGEKCVSCRKCEHACKAMCIDIDKKRVDTSRCVDCFDCLDQCPTGAIAFGRRHKSPKEVEPDGSRRRFIATSAALSATMAMQAQEQKFDGGLAVLTAKSIPQRANPLKPFGAQSLKNFSSRCTGCQLCVSQCPEHVLQPSTDLANFMQPQLSYSQGYCRTACNRCSQVCPTGAIQPVSKEEKTAISIGFAVTLHDNCVSAKGIDCGACARHCPSQAITMVDDATTGRRLPAVDESMCIGCGACEYYCPARPMTAIYVEGRRVHTER